MTAQERRVIYEQTKKRHANAGIAHAKALDEYNKAAMARGEAEADLFRSMTLEELEAQVARTQGRGDGRLEYLPERLRFSLREEAEEVFELLSRMNLAGHDQAVAAQVAPDLLLELGDVLNVITAIAMHAGFTLQEVAEANDAKMRARMPEGHPDTKEVK